MPVMVGDRQAGHVIRPVLQRDGRAMRGMVIRSQGKGMKWLKREQILLLGKMAVIAKDMPGKMPEDTDYRLFRVSDAEGERLGMVTDAILHEETLRVTALEISYGPIDDLIRGRWYATAFRVQPGRNTGHVTVLQKERG